MARWKIKSVGDPLVGTAKLAAHETKQLARHLKEEGFGSIKAARTNDELAVQLVRIVDGKGRPAFELYLSSFGSGALFDHGTTTLVGNVIQHHFELVKDRPTLPAELAAVFTKAATRRLGIATAIAFGTAPPTTAPRTPTNLAAALAISNHSARREAVATFAAPLFGKAAPYPKRRLTAEQRAFVAAIVDAKVDLELHGWGMFAQLEHNARAIGKAPAGPSDIEISIGKERMPLWRAVSDVASGHHDPAPVLAAFTKLAPAEALAAWNEIASDKAYDLFEAHAVKFSEGGIPRTPSNVKHRTRLFSWMADANLALGDAGVRAAEALTKTKITLDYRSGYPWAFIAILSLVRQATRAGSVLAEAHDQLVARLDGPHADAFAAPIVKEIEKTLPRVRLAAIAAIRTKRQGPR